VERARGRKEKFMNSIKIHSLEELTRRLDVTARVEESGFMVASTTGFMVASPSGFMVASTTGFMVASPSGFMVASPTGL